MKPFKLLKKNTACQSCGFGFIESRSGSSISSEFGYGSGSTVLQFTYRYVQATGEAFSTLWVIFALLGPNPDTDPETPIKSGSNRDTDPDPQHRKFGSDPLGIRRAQMKK